MDDVDLKIKRKRAIKEWIIVKVQKMIKVNCPSIRMKK